MFYKIVLKFNNSLIAKNYRKRKAKRLVKIYDHLNLLNNNTEIINGKELIKFGVNKNDSSIIYLRPFSSDLQVYSQVMVQKAYLPVIEIYEQVFKTEPTYLIDLGANIGLTSIFFAIRYKGLSITAVEPFNENVEMMELNMRANNLKNFKIIQGGIWNKNVRLTLKRDFRDRKEWGINLVEDNMDKIEGFCVQKLLRDYIQPIDFLKIDIEGSEAKLFENPIYASGFLKKVKCLAMEIHDEFKCRNSIYSILKENSFIYYNIQDMTIALNKNFI